MNNVDVGALYGRAVPPAANDAAQQLLRDALVADMIFVWEPSLGNDERLFPYYRKAGVDFVQCHPAGDAHNISQAVQLIGQFRRAVRQSQECRFVESVADIEVAREAGLLAVGLQLEGFRCLERNLDMIDVYYALGVRLCHPIHNLMNSIGGGCADSDDVGLSAFGRRVVAEMNRVGMIVDGTHAARRVQLDMIEHSAAPPVFSHHGAYTVHPHIRNVRDDVMRGCALRGGVVGLTGAGFYLGGEPTVERLFRHLDHMVQIAGPKHVGLAFDFLGDWDDQARFMTDYPDTFPGLADGAWEPVSFAPPSFLGGLVDEMLTAGYDREDVLNILGRNWLRVARETWQ